jgi:hypothetical protein
MTNFVERKYNHQIPSQFRNNKLNKAMLSPIYNGDVNSALVVGKKRQRQSQCHPCFGVFVDENALTIACVNDP